MLHEACMNGSAHSIASPAPIEVIGSIDYVGLPDEHYQLVV